MGTALHTMKRASCRVFQNISHCRPVAPPSIFSPITQTLLFPSILALQRRSFSSSNGITITFIDKDERIEVQAKEGETILELAQAHDVNLEGACEGSLACSTCHVIFEEKFYKTLNEPTDEENDMLDLAFGLTDTSRLGCQIKVTKALDGAVIRVPTATRNMAVDGFKPKH
eukprot:c11749_g1_i9.p1 GENE.c11749_g1_i9~~c11749_g1_i9.p1  ORF type:complete len:171 (-),score=29.17 c11749_g1_i9:1325-1837(-)